MKKFFLLTLGFLVSFTFLNGQTNLDRVKNNSAYLSFLPSNLKSKDLKPSDIPSKLVLKQMGFTDEEINEAMDYKFSRGKYSNTYNETLDTLSNDRQV